MFDQLADMLGLAGLAASVGGTALALRQIRLQRENRKERADHSPEIATPRAASQPVTPHTLTIPISLDSWFGSDLDGGWMLVRTRAGEQRASEAPGRVLHLPELTLYGYRPEVEIGADVDKTGLLATIHVALTSAPTASRPLRTFELAIVDVAGATQVADLGDYLYAQFRNVAVSTGANVQLSFTLVSERRLRS